MEDGSTKVKEKSRVMTYQPIILSYTGVSLEKVSVLSFRFLGT